MLKTGIKLDNGVAGLAAVLPGSTARGCTVLKEAGTYIGSPAAETLQYLVEAKDALRRAIGVATANALVLPESGKTEDREATTYLNLQPGEKVAMVGLFAPLVERIRSTGATLTDCDVAIITATTLLNGTFEETIGLLGRPRSVVLMGPSTPLVPEIFHDTPVTQLGGSIVADAAKALQVISEGGGTPALRHYLRFVNLLLPDKSR